MVSYFLDTVMFIGKWCSHKLKDQTEPISIFIFPNLPFD